MRDNGRLEPANLQGQLDKAALGRFKDSRILHPSLRAARDRIVELIDEPGGSAIFLVFGPTGVGKSTLIEAAVRSVVAARAKELDADPQLLPPIVVDAPVATGSTYPWRDFLVRCVDALGEPLIDRKVEIAPGTFPDGRAFRSVDGAQRAFERAVAARRPAAIFVDEAQHLANAGRARHQDQLDFIKSLADATNSVFFLVGTYELAELRNLNGQLGRRAWDVHFGRYGFDDPTFANVANTFAQGVGLEPAAMLDNLDYFYERSCGCVGILKAWFIRAYARALRSGRAINADDVAATALSAQASRTIAIEISKGERDFAETDEIIQDLRENLGMVPSTSPAPALSRAPSLRVGKRAPVRDEVGVR